MPPLEELSMGYAMWYHYSWMALIPSLRRLLIMTEHFEPFCNAPAAWLANLQMLRLTLHGWRRHNSWTYLPHCTQLRTLQVDTPLKWKRDLVPELDVVAAVAASAATLQTMILGANWAFERQQPGSWVVLAQCQQLTSLSMRLQPLDWEAVLAALSGLPRFSALTLFVCDLLSLPLPAGLLRHMTARPDSQWHTVQLDFVHVQHILRLSSERLERLVPSACKICCLRRRLLQMQWCSACACSSAGVVAHAVPTPSPWTMLGGAAGWALQPPAQPSGCYRSWSPLPPTSCA